LSCGNFLPYPGLPVERLYGGEPVIAPTDHWWESGVTFNTATVYLSRSAEHDPVIARLLGTDTLDNPLLRDGVVAMHYRARPKDDPGYRWTRSFMGLAVFTPDTTHLLKRYEHPLVSPDTDPIGIDYLGVEDPRITRIGDTYYSVYCGVADLHDRGRWRASLCMAQSHDLLHWTKLGGVLGDINTCNNKDGVLFPEVIDGRYFFLHRPMDVCLNERTMNLAVSDSPTGEWKECGAILGAAAHDHQRCRASWVGAGSVPIPLGDHRYLVIFHTGNRLNDGRLEYDLDAAIFNMNNFDPADPSTIVEARINRIMVPETDCEVNGPYPDSVANVLFTCGTYEYQGYLYILYGGGDTFVMSARIELQALLDALATNRVETRELLSAV
ncbi:MAG TPA: hypothetical protein VHV83_01210, partial [Armatimonadota bacterium]|nr:hypothetical protein [Armatimonadota bacterium]